MPLNTKNTLRASTQYTAQTAQMKGYELEYIDVGNGPVLLLLHGALSDMHNWDKLISILQHNYRCIAPTLPLGGHRLAIRGAADLSVKGVAVIIEQFIRALHLPPVHVIANDTGGAYAQMLAAEHASCVCSLILTNCDALDVFPPKPFAMLPKAVNIPGYIRGMAMFLRFSALVKSPLAMGLLSHTLTAKELKRPLASFFTAKDIQTDFKNVASAWRTETTQELAVALTNFVKPVQLIWGADDELFPTELGRRLSKVFSHANFKIVNNARTYIQCDQPAALAHHISSFIDTL